MKRSVFVFAAAAAIVAGSLLAAQQAVRRGAPPAPMGFFVTSVGIVTAGTSAVFRAPTPTARSSPRHRAGRAPATECGART